MNKKQRAMEERHIKRDRQFTEDARKQMELEYLARQETVYEQDIVDYIESIKAPYYTNYNPSPKKLEKLRNLRETSYILLEQMPHKDQTWDTLRSVMVKEWQLRQTKLYKALR